MTALCAHLCVSVLGGGLCDRQNVQTCSVGIQLSMSGQAAPWVGRAGDLAPGSLCRLGPAPRPGSIMAMGHGDMLWGCWASPCPPDRMHSCLPWSSLTFPLQGSGPSVILGITPAPSAVCGWPLTPQMLPGHLQGWVWYCSMSWSLWWGWGPGPFQAAACFSLSLLTGQKYLPVLKLGCWRLKCRHLSQYL